VSLRARIVAYVVALHLMFAGLAIFLLLRNPFWLLAVEAMFGISLVVGIRLSRDTFRKLGFAAEGVRLIRDEEFTSRFLEVGQPEIDELIGVYNRMVDHLREERVRLAEQHHFLSQVLQASPSGIVVLDFDERVATMNPAAERLLDTAASGAIGRRIVALDSPLAPALATLPPGSSCVVGLRGARRVKCQHGTFIDRGFVRSFLLVEELTEELRQFERAAYEKLIRVMSHEVNNTVAASNSLLHSSLTYAGQLGTASRTDFTHAIGIVIERTEQLNAFMRGFADVFRLPPPLLQPTDLVAVLAGLVRLLSAKPDAAGITWRWELDQRAVSVRMDRGQMEQAFLNILKNAIEAIDGCGTIVLRVTSGSGRVALVIEDSGRGISAEAQTNLFTPFFSTKPHGQGIGLTLVQEILSGHGFDYSLERTGDETTRFTIQFRSQSPDTATFSEGTDERARTRSSSSS
jgi:nitrogen fixation/metabolism regulation signal transduction histidine kinase